MNSRQVGRWRAGRRCSTAFTEEDTAMTRTALTLVQGIMVVALGMLWVASAEAVNCGDKLGPGGSFTLTADLGPCATSVALTVQGPVTVDLGGHAVSGSTGILIIGSQAQVRNGFVTGCNIGVDI